MAAGVPMTLIDSVDGDKPYGVKQLSQTREDLLVQAGFGYTVSTSVVAVSAGNYLNAILANPANSGVNLLLTSRVLTIGLAAGQVPAEYGRYSGATLFAAQVAGQTVIAVGNRRQGGAPFPGTLTFAMGGAPLVGTLTSGGFLPTNGMEKRIKELVIIPPGSSLAYTIGGGNNGLAGAARAVMTFLFVTEPVSA